ncbi:hypothetical protein D6158_26530 [Nocardia seriolae]|nr:hypothetical protein C6575_26760 [Nocardia seriolae]RLP28955.1 hypothetical protein D6158_26530 [Nocardia seriolae]
MGKRQITIGVGAVVVAVITGCGSHRSAPLTPPATATSVPFLGGGRIPDVIDMTTPTTTARPTTTVAPTTTVVPTTTVAPTTTETVTATPMASATRAG